MTTVSATVVLPVTNPQDGSADSVPKHSFSSLLRFLDPALDPSKHGSADVNRAPKRRKLAGGNSVAVQPAEEFDETASALLKTITVDFVSFEDVLLTDSPGAG